MKYAIYARVSPKGSDFEGDTTIAMQMEICRKWVAERGGIIVREESDEFFSGKDLKRPGFTRIMKELESGRAEWDTLLVYKLSRMTRSLRDGADIFDKLFRQGRGFASATENLDFSSPAGRAMLGMMQVFNQFEREQTAENTRNKMMQIARRGEWPVGKPPFGYKRGAKGDNVLYIDERKGPIVRDIFEMYAGNTDRTQRILTKYKGIVTNSNLFLILRNRVYLGEICYNGQTFPGKHEPLISQDLFDRVQQTLPQKKFATRPKAQHYPYLMSGLLFCSCGRRMNALSAKSGAYHYYVCPACRKRISAEKADFGLLEFLQNLKIPPHFLTRARPLLEAEQRKTTAKKAPELDRMKRELQSCETEQQKIIDQLLKLDPSPVLMKRLDQRTMELENRKQELTRKISEKKSELALGVDYYTIALDMLDKLQKLHELTGEIDETTMRQAILANIEQANLEGEEIRLMPSSTISQGWLPRREIVELLRLVFSFSAFNR